MTTAADVEDPDELDDLLGALLAASRTLVAVSAQSIASVLDEERRLDLMQVRILVVVASNAPCTLGEIADGTGLHVSTASRTCDRMVSAGLLRRTESETDRRNLEIVLTPSGEEIVGRVMRHRRAALRAILAGLGVQKRRRLARAMREFAAAAGEPSDRALWAMGWTTDNATQEVSR